MEFLFPFVFLFALLRFVFVLLCFVFVLLCFVFVHLYFVFAPLTICICSSCACLHQIFPNASDQISLALFCTFRERERGRRLPAALWLRKYQDEITASFSLMMPQPSSPSSYFLFHSRSTKQDYRRFRICPLWEFVTF